MSCWRRCVPMPWRWSMRSACQTTLSTPALAATTVPAHTIPPLLMHTGNVYEAMYAAAQLEPLNKSQVCARLRLAVLIGAAGGPRRARVADAADEGTARKTQGQAVAPPLHASGLEGICRGGKTLGPLWRAWCRGGARAPPQWRSGSRPPQMRACCSSPSPVWRACANLYFEFCWRRLDRG